MLAVALLGAVVASAAANPGPLAPLLNVSAPESIYDQVVAWEVAQFQKSAAPYAGLCLFFVRNRGGEDQLPGAGGGPGARPLVCAHGAIIAHSYSR